MVYTTHKAMVINWDGHKIAVGPHPRPTITKKPQQIYVLLM